MGRSLPTWHEWTIIITFNLAAFEALGVDVDKRHTGVRVGVFVFFILWASRYAFQRPALLKAYTPFPASFWRAPKPPMRALPPRAAFLAFSSFLFVDFNHRHSSVCIQT